MFRAHNLRCAAPLAGSGQRHRCWECALPSPVRCPGAGHEMLRQAQHDTVWTVAQSALATRAACRSHGIMCTALNDSGSVGAFIPCFPVLMYCYLSEQVKVLRADGLARSRVIGMVTTRAVPKLVPLCHGLSPSRHCRSHALGRLLVSLVGGGYSAGIDTGGAGGDGGREARAEAQTPNATPLRTGSEPRHQLHFQQRVRIAGTIHQFWCIPKRGNERTRPQGRQVIQRGCRRQAATAEAVFQTG